MVKSLMKWSEPNFSPNNEFQTLLPLPSKFYLRPAPVVAKALLGKGLYIKQNDNELLCQIVEVEAYLGDSDPASHAYRGPRTRNQSMFETGGTCYVYLSYGVNHCMNVVTDKKGVGAAVLIRAAIPLVGLPLFFKRRRKTPSQREKDLKSLMNGPGKLTQSLGIDLKYDGMRFDQPDLKIVDLNCKVPKQLIGISPRIGISKAKDYPYRFFINSCAYISRPNFFRL